MRYSKSDDSTRLASTGEVKVIVSLGRLSRGVQPFMRYTIYWKDIHIAQNIGLRIQQPFVECRLDKGKWRHQSLAYASIRATDGRFISRVSDTRHQALGIV